MLGKASLRPKIEEGARTVPRAGTRVRHLGHKVLGEALTLARAGDNDRPRESPELKARPHKWRGISEPAVPSQPGRERCLHSPSLHWPRTHQSWPPHRSPRGLRSWTPAGTGGSRGPRQPWPSGPDSSASRGQDGRPARSRSRSRAVMADLPLCLGNEAGSGREMKSVPSGKGRGW